MRVLSQVAGTAFGRLLVDGCSSTDSDRPAEVDAGSGGETGAWAGSSARQWRRRGPWQEAARASRRGVFFESWAGSISVEASSNFYFDAPPETASHTPPDAYDFMSIAEHELGHVLGFASGMAFTHFTSGTTFRSRRRAGSS